MKFCQLKKIIIYVLVFSFSIYNIYPFSVSAESIIATTTSAVNFRKGPSTDYGYWQTIPQNATVTLLSRNKEVGKGCSNGFYQVSYNGNNGYVCSDYISINGEDVYGRPWSSPKKSITGGAKFLGNSYISKGQNTSYLQKFNVNPNGYYNIFTHQYMANLAAPASEARTSFTSYQNNNLLSLPLEFSIPVYLNMPDETNLPNQSNLNIEKNDVTDQSFEDLLNQEGFPESYKSKLRAIHDLYPNWRFKALHTNIDFNYAVGQEKYVSSINGNSAYYDDPLYQTEPGWYRANDQTVSFYLDSRNFLGEKGILMFEDLAFSENYTESTINSILKNTFMEGYSFLDNQSYATIFLEAGRNANVSPVHLASRARQESGANGGLTTNGNRFTYEGLTYEGFYNFFNIGAYGGSNPAMAGLVYASQGAVANSDGIIMGNKGEDNPDPNSAKVAEIIAKLETTTRGNLMVNINLGTSANQLLSKVNGYDVVIKNSSGQVINGSELMATGMTISFLNQTYNIIIYGDLNGDGLIDSGDLLKMRQHLLGNSLNGVYLEAGKTQKNNLIDSSDLLALRQHLLGTKKINQG